MKTATMLDPAGSQLITVVYDPIRGSIFECESCGHQFRTIRLTELPTSCGGCKSDLSLFPDGFPQGFLRHALPANNHR